MTTPLRAAYLGPPGTHSEAALRAGADVVGGAVEGVPVATLPEVVLAVQEGLAERAIAPVESYSEGSVDVTIDTLAARAPDVTIVGEVILPVRHALCAAPGVALDDVAVVVSHPQALAQCRAWLRRTLPDARQVAWTSTAEAVREAGARGGAGEGWAGIGTTLAASLYGCAVLEDGIEDLHGNATRFAWLAPAGTAPLREADKTSIVFAGAGADAPGWLVGCLSQFASRGVNLTRIESRPRHERLGDYLFFLDLDGGLHEPRVGEAVEALRSRCEVVRVLGSYPSA